MGKEADKSSTRIRRDDDDYYEERCSSSHSNTYSFRGTDQNDNGGKKRKIDSKLRSERRLRHDSDSSSDTIEMVVTGVKAPWPEDLDSASPGNLFGLNLEYIRSLGITPPLDKWIHVTNFRCDKSELKEVLELAGRVIICAVITIRERFAKVMYSHPLEAVQAVSMLNGQTFYGQKLIITMIPCPTDTVILPKGLANVGPGLGIKGKPLTDIVQQYKKFTKLKESLVDTTIFSLSDDDYSEYSNKDIKKKKLSIDSDSDDDHKDKTNQNPNDRRHVSFKIKSVEELHNNICSRSIKADSQSNSPSSDIDKQTKNDECSKRTERDNVSSKNLQIRQSFQIPTVSTDKPASRASTASPGFGSQPRPVPFPQNLTPNPVGPQVNPRLNLSAIRPQGFNIPSGSPNIPMRPMAPQGGNMPIGPGMIMSSSGPAGFNPGPPGVVGPPGPSGPGMCGPGPIRMNMGPGPNPVMNMSGPGGFGPPRMNVSPSLPNLRPPGVGPSPAPVPPVQMPAADSFGLEFSNLPPSTTFPLLCEKVSRCGQVLSLQLTTPGCAVARFSVRAHAERCFQVFNGLCIDGCIIQTRYT